MGRWSICAEVPMSDTRARSRPWKSTRYWEISHVFRPQTTPKLFGNCLSFFIVSSFFRFLFLVSIAFALTASNYFSHPLSAELFNLLGGPLWHGDSTEDLWDLFPRFKDAEGVGAFSGGGQESRPSQDWQSESLRVVISRPTQMAEALDRMPLLKWFWFIIV